MCFLSDKNDGIEQYWILYQETSHFGKAGIIYNVDK